MTPEELRTAQQLFRAVMDAPPRTDRVAMIAAALRAAESSALERAAREAEALSSNYDKQRAEIADGIAEAIRALAHPAVAPAAEPAKVLRHVTPRTKIVGDYICEKCERHDHSDHSPGWGGICIGCACSFIDKPSEPVAPADPCQRCGKLGGHVVDFRFDGILMGSWICPHCLDAQEKRIAALEVALRELSRRASDPDLYRRIGASWLMLDGAVKEADALLTKEPRK